MALLNWLRKVILPALLGLSAGACDTGGSPGERIAEELTGAVRSLAPGQTLAMTSINRGDWDTLFFFSPYTANDTIEAALQSKLPAEIERARLHERDDIFLLVFVSKGEARLVAAIPRGSVDFADEGAGRPLSRDAAIFRKTGQTSRLTWVAAAQ